MKTEERKQLIERNQGLYDFLVKNEENFLKIEAWTDADEDGMSGGVDLTFSYEDDINVQIKAVDGVSLRKAEISCWPNNEFEIPLTFTEDQKELITLWLQEAYDNWCEQERDAREYNRDIYAYHGVRRSDFY